MAPTPTPAKSRRLEAEISEPIKLEKRSVGPKTQFPKQLAEVIRAVTIALAVIQAVPRALAIALVTGPAIESA